jgi:hypothetical protein
MSATTTLKKLVTQPTLNVWSTLVVVVVVVVVVAAAEVVRKWKKKPKFPNSY